MKRLTRTLVYEGTDGWLDAILALNYLGPGRPLAVQPEGTIRETERRVEDLPDAPTDKEIAADVYRRTRLKRVKRAAAQRRKRRARGKR